MRPITTLLSALALAFALLACSDYKFHERNDAEQDTADTLDPDRPDDDDGGGGDDTDCDVFDDSGWDGDDGSGGDGGGGGDAGGPPDDGVGDLMGRICDPSGTSWVVGATVYISVDTDGDGVEDYRIETTTDADGYFLLEDIPPGTWTVTVEKGSFSTTFVVEVVEGEVVVLPEPECLDPDSVEIAVITGEYDDIGAILDALTVSYDEYDGTSSTDYLDLLLDPVALGAYDIVFINCGEHAIDWVSDYRTEVTGNLSDYVYSGGSVYASDWAYPFVELSWASSVDWYEDAAYADDAVVNAALMGDVGDLTGTILDANMQAVLGSAVVDLHYDLNNWAVPVSAGADAVALVEGTAPLVGGGSVSGSPLALEITKGSGRVIYTTFHNERQATVDMELLLNEIILSL